uniref:FMN-binding protein n=1 Tax=Frankia tisae TaxID=2950104 RepID=UPI0021BE65E2
RQAEQGGHHDRGKQRCGLEALGVVVDEAADARLPLPEEEVTDVVAVQIPDRERRDVEINDQAVPILRQEVLDAQSAYIDSVSGASFTSTGYAWSVQSALDRSRA